MVTRGDSFPSTRLSLVGRLRGELSKDWETFFAIYGPLVYRMARHAGLRDDEAEGVVSQVMRDFLSAVRGGFAVDHEVGRFRSYLRTAANNAIRAHLRARRRNGNGKMPLTEDLAEAPDDTTVEWERMEQLERLRLCFERLRASPAVRRRDVEAFESLVLRGEDAQAVAKRLGITVARVYGIKHEMVKLLRRIRQKLDQEMGEV
jgi:RNA polymerase sigma-70 factor (ECF subfamily)